MDHHDWLALFDDYEDGELAAAANLLHDQAQTLMKGGNLAGWHEYNAMSLAATVVLFARQGPNKSQGISNS